MPETITRVCVAHGVETRLQCAECGEPICLRCQVRTEVGLKCERCAKLPASALPRRRVRALVAALVGGIVVAAVVAAVVVRLVAGAPAVKVPAQPAAVGSWRSLPDLGVLRGGTTAVRLPDGRVLAVGGGIGAIPLAGSEVYDPSTALWSPSGTLHNARRGNETVVFADGRVLTVGGLASGQVLFSAEIWNPSTGTWTEAAPMHQARFNFVLALLPDGRVLAAGGTDASTTTALATAEIFDPKANTWMATAGAMTASRSDAAGVPLRDGRVLIVGGFSEQLGTMTAEASAEIFDPVVGVFTRASSMQQARQDFTLTVLTDGRVLAAGGSAGNTALASAEMFDPTSGSWTGTGSMFQPRRLDSASLLADGSVLVSGGEAVASGSRTSLTSAEIYRPATGRWVPAASLTCPRSAEAQVTLSSGTVIVVGGDAAFPGQPPRAQSCTELFTP